MLQMTEIVWRSMNESQNKVVNKTVAGAAPDIADRYLDQRFRIVKIAAASYLLDALFLFALTYTGAIGIAVPVGYLCAGLVATVSISLAYKTGLHLRFQHPSLGLPFLVYGVLLQLVSLYLFPSIGFFFIINTFNVFSFGLVVLSTRQFLWALGLSSVAAMVVFAGISGDIVFPIKTLYGRTILLLVFLLTLGRCVALSMYVSGLRASLTKKNKALWESHKQIEELASQDELTSVANRRSLMIFLLAEKTRADRTGSKLCVAIFDLDHFKSVNDKFGHLVGDKALKEFAATTCSVLRETDQFGRLGGEEFLLVLPFTSLDGAMIPLERIR